MKLPLNIPYPLMLTRWSSILNPVVTNTIVNGVAFAGISLTASTPKTIQISLPQQQRGWFLTDNTANANIWRTEPFNAQTLTLESSADTTISLWVF